MTILVDENDHDCEDGDCSLRDAIETASAGDTIGFYVPSQLKWYLKNNQINGWNDYVAFKFGGPTGSQPVAGDWQ